MTARYAKSPSRQAASWVAKRMPSLPSFFAWRICAAVRTWTASSLWLSMKRNTLATARIVSEMPAFPADGDPDDVHASGARLLEPAFPGHRVDQRRRIDDEAFFVKSPRSGFLFFGQVKHHGLPFLCGVRLMSTFNAPMRKATFQFGG